MKNREKILDLIRGPIAKSLGLSPDVISERTGIPFDLEMDYQIIEKLEEAKLWLNTGFDFIQLREGEKVGKLINLIIVANNLGED